LPDTWKTLLGAEKLGNMIENALSEAKIAWEKNPNLIGGGK
jgi:hypothetical protein